jgi:S-(hydroxymethyl)glutathione dehydrogenase/alcohol dehydrogenase
MRAAVLRETRQPMTIETVDLDGPRADEIRVRVKASGLCHSDYHVMTGDLPMPMPVVLGHEAAGIVEAVGENVRGFKVGDAVVTSLSGFCGVCHECQTGHSHRCDDKPGRPGGLAGSRITQNGKPLLQFGNLGGFAEEMVVHQSAAARLPEGVPMASAALLGCAVLTGVGAVVNGAKVEPGSTVAVIGCGGVGLNVIQGARLAGALRIIAVDLSPAKLEFARAFGATDVVVASQNSAAEVVELTKGGVDYAFEVIGLTATMRDAFMMLRKGGAAVLVGVAPIGSEISLPTTQFLFKEVRVMGAIMGSSPAQLFIPELARHYLNGALKLDELVSRTISLDEVNEGYASMAAREVARNVIVF